LINQNCFNIYEEADDGLLELILIFYAYPWFEHILEKGGKKKHSSGKTKPNYD